MAGKVDRITVRLSDEDRAWLDARAEEDGLEISDVVRMLVRRARRGVNGRGEQAFGVSLPEANEAAERAMREEAERGGCRA